MLVFRHLDYLSPPPPGEEVLVVFRGAGYLPLSVFKLWKFAP